MEELVYTAERALASTPPANRRIRYEQRNRTLYGERGSVRLSEKEARLFALLLSQKVLDRAAAASLFPDGVPESNIVDVYIHYLRNKLRRISPQELLTAARGVGYTLCSDAFTVS